jgi:hypothetical protein
MVCWIDELDGGAFFGGVAIISNTRAEQKVQFIFIYGRENSHE